ncbi:phosphoenolpyruvate carboxykinase (ATP) [Paenibacillus kobensis]|uniref:ATP-binding cassette domain-containing protein n=1 Tax=Paenibacillus kobensis TaxID=59841 RepID=UPI000FD8AD40|nr:ATP-binding cassette domain-containing protein [Paenibacillus kobensis]
MARSEVSVYNAFGMTIMSEIPFPELCTQSQYAGSPDVEVIRGDLAPIWEQLGVQRGYFAYVDHCYYFNVPDVAIYRVEKNGVITVSPADGCSTRKLRLFLLGSCMGVILLNRGILPLHGSAVVIGGKAYAIVGESGAGKSTLAAALLHRGYKLLTDDVIAVTMDPDNNRPVVIPSYPQQKLWEESVESLQLDHNGLETLYQEKSRSKYAVPVHDSYISDNIPLAGIVELVKSDGDAGPKLQRLNGLEPLPLLFQHTYRNYHIPMLGLFEWHFKYTTRLSETTDIFRLNRPASGLTVNELVSIILNEAGEGVSV